MSSFVDLTGQRFERWTVVERTSTPLGSNIKKAFWLCRCDCGRTGVVVSNNLRSGLSKSCGCLHVERAAARRYKHGFTSKTNFSTFKSEHGSWRAMIQRCYDTDFHSYPDYGGRGIVVCERWLESFANFISDMGCKPTSAHSIDRIDNNGNYEPGNCRWATASEQMLNQRRSRKHKQVSA